ncbi:DUF421 domain-containing protein [Paenibacillus eucommiae]|uniref:Uncharacterized membrane protein YcaP (DUF421 family) n=1 Tax=Paenibacillus eucommiae TaxID=1355755 RepID=A0ABS4IZF6_9BACL|nr:DUF421 domain-containing protein [Paenibacillus eucommiae]MBP1992938.1 uncharacterized membrane protein YcaP (DUF421 family) [Paenibacillus eucommiae]
MDFFASKESLTTIEWILRGIVSFIFLLLTAKLMGQRSISQLRFLDFIIALTLGNIIAHPLSDEELGLKGSMITTIVLILLYVTVTWLSLKWPFLKRYLDPPPITLVKDGLIQFHNLSKARISIDFLFSELRKEKVEDIQKVSLAIWEPGGTISVFMDTPYQPVTPADMKLETQPFTISRPIIIDGTIDLSLLQEIGKDLEWLHAKIAFTPANIRDVILATVTENENVQVYAETKKKRSPS